MMRVLIVEDDRRLANVLRSAREEEEGFGVDVVSQAEEAIAAASTTPFDNPACLPPGSSVVRENR